MNAPEAHKNVGEGFTGAMPIRFYGPVGNGFHPVPWIGTEADPYKAIRQAVAFSQ